MSGFRRPVTVYRKTGGGYDAKGRWQEGQEAQLTIQASVQPLKPMEMQSLPEGRRSRSAIKAYTDTQLQRAEQAREGVDAVNGDILGWFGRRYEVIDVLPYQAGVLPHFKIIAVEVGE